MKKVYLIFLSFLLFSVPVLSSAMTTGTVGSIKVSVDGVVINNHELAGKIEFLPIISSRDVELELALGACWDGGLYNINVNNGINNINTTIEGTSPSLLNCSDWFGASPAKYTIRHDRPFNGQTVNFEYSGENSWPNRQEINIKVFEDTKREKSTSELNNKFSGYIMLNVEDSGKAYYISPISKKAYYLAIPKISFQVMRGTGVGITNKDLEKIPVGGECPDYISNCDKINSHDASFANKHKGYIFLQVEENGEAWYIHPEDGKRYFLGTPENAFEIMKSKGMGINNDNFNKLELAYSPKLDPTVKRLDITEISQGTSSHYDEKEDLVIKDESTWKAVWEKHISNRDPQPELPNVDFSNEMVIAVFNDIKPSGGYSVEILMVKDKPDRVEVFLIERSPSPEEIVTSALTQPYHIIKIPKSDKQIYFNRVYK